MTQRNRKRNPATTPSLDGSTGVSPSVGTLFPNVTNRSLDSLVLNPKNARQHSREQLYRLQRCIATNGFLVPVLIDEDGNVVLGHGRIMAARELGLQQVPTLTVTGLSSTQLRAFAIAENRLSDLADWNYDTLRIEFAELLELQADVEDTAFGTGEIDIILDGKADQPPSTEDPIPPIEPGKAISQVGDIWRLEKHRLLCGDARDPDAYLALLKGELASTVFTDPPYNVRIDGHASGLGAAKHREFTMASGEMSRAQFTAFLKAIFAQLVRHSRLGSIHYVCMDWRHLREILEAGADTYAELKNLCVWNKNNAGMGSFYRSKHELVLVFQNGSGRFQNNVSLGKTGRYRTNVWDYPGMTAISKGRAEKLAMHPTVKPVALVADALRDSSKRNDLVLDPFSGSGTTLIAAHRTGRLCAAMELDPAYVDVAVRRWETVTGIPAILESSGKSFADMQAQRTALSGDSAEVL